MFGLDKHTEQSDDSYSESRRHGAPQMLITQQQVSGQFVSQCNSFSLPSIKLHLQSVYQDAIGNCAGFDPIQLLRYSSRMISTSGGQFLEYGLRNDDLPINLAQ